MIKAAIAGGAGYTAGELIRILINHPCAELKYIHSNSFYGKDLHQVHHDLIGETDLKFTDIDFSNIDVLFLCMGHGKSGDYLKSHNIPEDVKIIDLSNEFRLKEDAQDFVYGLPEINKEKIKSAQKIANPGCFATSIELGLLPLAATGKLKGDVYINAITGSTGAGQKPGTTTHFSWRDSNLSTYKEFTHQHMDEIKETLKSYQKDIADIHFIPIRGCHTRGILASIITDCHMDIGDIYDLYQGWYSHHPFVHVTDSEISLKQVVNTNKCVINIKKQNNKVLIVSTIDNLIKGASGQAIQNMNLMFSLEENAGLKLKPTAH